MLLQTSDVKIKKISQTGNTGIFEYSPLPGGFGRTLGNTLRRILLTSLQGTAITQVRFPKVSHEFTTIPGVKEDVVELCQNLKNVQVLAHTNNPVIGKISKSGPGPVTAGDIEVSSEIEIVNKDLHIADLSDKKTSFDVEITFENGVGYLPIKGRSSNKVGVILLDALFSPVTKVAYEVDATRLNDVTGLDKLRVTVETNGAIDASEALTQASTILRNFFSRFARGEDPEELLAQEEAEKAAASASVQDKVYLDDLSLPTRTINALKKHGVETLSALAALSDEELADVKNLGDKSVKEIQKLLKKEGLK